MQLIFTLAHNFLKYSQQLTLHNLLFKMHFFLLSSFIIIAFLLSTSIAFFGKNKEADKDEDKNKINKKMNSKDTARLGMESLLEVSQDPLAMKELMSSLDDPETMKEVEKLMKDPAFISEIENLKNDPQFIRQFSAASDLYNDPLKQARVMGQIRAHQAIQEKERQQQQHHQSDVELGLSELAKAAKNPKMLADAMEALKDPEVAREVCSKG